MFPLDTGSGRQRAGEAFGDFAMRTHRKICNLTQKGWNSMRLIWNGHSCFTLETAGGTVVVDPYLDGSVPGLAPIRLGGDDPHLAR